MSNSTITFDAIIQSQASKEVTANAMFDALSPASAFGRRQSTTSGLNWGYYGANMLVNGVFTQIANGILALTASTTCYVEATTAGVVSFNTTGFTAGRIALYQVVTGASTISSYTDRRNWVFFQGTAGRISIAMADANTTLSDVQCRNDIVEFTGTLTVQRNIVIPLAVRQWTVFNNTAGGFGLQFIGTTGTGVVVAAGKRAILYGDGTNIVRVTADA